MVVGLIKKGLKALSKGAGKALLSSLQAIGPYVILAVAAVMIVYAIFNYVQKATLDEFVSALENNAQNTDTESLLEYIDTMSEAELTRYLAEYDINLKTFKQ